MINTLHEPTQALINDDYIQENSQHLAQTIIWDIF